MSYQTRLLRCCGRLVLFPLLLLMAGHPSGAQAEISIVVPIAEEVAHDWTIYQAQSDAQVSPQWSRIDFGYVNVGDTVRTVQIGLQNTISPAPTNRGQPTQFQLGHNPTVWGTIFNPNHATPLTWTLLGESASFTPGTGTSYVRRLTIGDSTTISPTVFPTSDLPAGSSYDTLIHTLSTPDPVSPSLVVEGNGNLIMQSGTFTHETVANNPTGTIRLQGGLLEATTSLTNSSDFFLEGGSFSTPEFSQTNGGHIHVVSGSYALPLTTNPGRITVDGGSATLPSLETTGIVSVHSGSLEIAGSLDLQTNSLLVLTGGVAAIGSIERSGGGIQFDGGRLEVTAADLTFGAGGAFGTQATVGVGSELVATNNDLLVAANAGVDVTSSSTLQAVGGENEGAIGVFDSQLLLTGTTQFENRASGQINAVDAELGFTGGLLNAGSLVLVNSTVNGPLQSPGGSSILVGGSVVFTGHVSGAANFTGLGAAVFEGGYSPGDSPALVTHEGDVVFGDSNTLTMEIGGLLRGDEYDALDIGGTLSLDGHLSIQLIDDFAPELGDSFQLFDAGTFEGTFSSMDLPTLASGLGWDVSELNQMGGLSVVPEPSHLVLILFGSSVLFLQRRTRASSTHRTAPANSSTSIPSSAS